MGGYILVSCAHSNTSYIAGTELTYSITTNYIAGTELTNMQIPHFYRTGVSSGGGTAYHSGTPAFIPSFSGVRVALYFTFFVMFCRSLFVLLIFPPLVSSNIS